MRKDILNAIKDLKGVKKMINKSELARRFGCSINTVNRYLEIQNTDEKVKRKYSSKLDEYKGIIIEKVDDFSANGKSIYNFIKEKGYTGSYGIVSKFIKEHKKEEQQKATMRFETTPAFQAQVDWKENFKIINKEGKEFEINVFLMILGYSRYKYIELTLDKTQDTLRFIVTRHKAQSKENGLAARSVEMIKEDAGKILKAVLQIYKKEKVEVKKRQNCFLVAVKNATKCESLSENVPERNRAVFKKDSGIQLYNNEVVPLLRTILTDAVCILRGCRDCPMRNESRNCCLTILRGLEQEDTK